MLWVHTACQSSVHADQVVSLRIIAVPKPAEVVIGTFMLSANQHSASLLHVADEQIDVIRVSKVKENKQARDKHVLGLLTCLRAVFPGDVTECIGRQILPYAKYDVVPDELQLKQPIKLKKNIQYEE